MKNNKIAHPIFKPFHELSVDEVTELILAKETNFRKEVKNGKTIIDHSACFEKWQELLEYVSLNNKFIYKEFGFIY